MASRKITKGTAAPARKKKTVRTLKVAISAFPTAQEAAAWQPLAATASAAILFWQQFMQFRKGAGAVLNATDIDRITRLVRAMSWVESNHGTGTGNHPARDPMQCGNPADAWWPQLANSGTVFDRYVGGPGASNLNANQLPNAVKDKVPAAAKVGSLGSVSKGHDDPAFNNTMSFYWAVPHLVWKINKLAAPARDFYLFGDVSRAELLEGAYNYNGNGNPAYRTKVDEVLTATGWPLTGILDSQPQAGDDVATLSAALKQSLDSLQSYTGKEKLFPHGLARFSLTFTPGSAATYVVEAKAAPAPK